MRGGDVADNVVRFSRDRPRRGRVAADRRPGSAEPQPPMAPAQSGLDDKAAPVSADDFWSGELPMHDAVPANDLGLAPEFAPVLESGVKPDGKAEPNADSAASADTDGSLYSAGEEFVPLSALARASDDGQVHVHRRRRVYARSFRVPIAARATAALLIAAGTGYALLAPSDVHRPESGAAQTARADSRAAPLDPLAPLSAAEQRQATRELAAASRRRRRSRISGKRHHHRSRMRRRGTLVARAPAATAPAATAPRSSTAANLPVTTESPAAPVTYEPSPASRTSSSYVAPSSAASSQSNHAFGYGGMLGPGSSPSG